VSETGYDSSPKTRGVTLRARKPPRTAASDRKSKPDAADEASAGAFVAATVEDLLARSLALGAESAKIIDTGTVAVEKWVKWKCMYGCPMYAKDRYHPPATPDLEEVREVLGEYSRAILIGGRDGRFLSEVACRLEGEAYRSGFYKAFALIALPPGPESGTALGGT
jgi:hypothetical protein